LPACSSPNFGLARTCGVKADGGCPSLAGHCVAQTAWLGQSPPSGAQTARNNVFPTQAACTAATALASDHPGVEDPSHSIGPCRELCGPNTSACPCGAPELVAWIAQIFAGIFGNIVF
jgi:hypothetical protein